MNDQLKTNLIFIEGIPGSGKSTLTQRISKYIQHKDTKVISYNEGDLQPIDFAWCGYLSTEEYHELLKKYPEKKSEIIQCTNTFSDGVVVAYNTLENEELIKHLSSKEIFDGRISAEQFMQLHLSRYKEFIKNTINNDEINLFECTILQNQVNELLSFHQYDSVSIKNYINELTKIVMPLSPVLIYLKQNHVDKTLENVAKERISEDKTKYPDWIEFVIQYVNNSPYGQLNNLQGYNGVVKYLENRQEIELDIVKSLPIKKYIIENDDYNWDNIFSQIQKILVDLGIK